MVFTGCTFFNSFSLYSKGPSLFGADASSSIPLSNGKGRSLVKCPPIQTGAFCESHYHVRNIPFNTVQDLLYKQKLACTNLDMFCDLVLEDVPDISPCVRTIIIQY